MEPVTAILPIEYQETLLTATDVIFQNYNLNFEIGSHSKVGVFARNEETIHEFLLVISGILRSKGLLYQGASCYDNARYFAKRIYADTHIDYFSTLSAKVIASTILKEFHKEVDEEKLSRLIRTLSLRRECVVRDAVEYTPMGKTMILLSTLLSTSCPLIIRHPLQYLNHEMSQYFVNEMTQKEETLIFGGGPLKSWEGKLDALILLGDNGKACVMDPSIQALYYVVGTPSENALFVDEVKNGYIILDQDKGTKVAQGHKQPKAIKINPYELEKIFA